MLRNEFLMTFLLFYWSRIDLQVKRVSWGCIPSWGAIPFKRECDVMFGGGKPAAKHNNLLLFTMVNQIAPEMEHTHGEFSFWQSHGSILDGKIWDWTQFFFRIQVDQIESNEGKPISTWKIRISLTRASSLELPEVDTHLRRQDGRNQP